MYMGARLTHTHTHTHTDDAAGSLARTPSWGHVNRFIYRMCCLYIECVCINTGLSMVKLGSYDPNTHTHTHTHTHNIAIQGCEW